MERSPKQAILTVHPTKASITKTLLELIHKSFLKATTTSSSPSSPSFYIAISGGSLPSFLKTLPQSFIDAKIDPQWDKWHVLLADERLVPSTHDDSNLGSIKKQFLDDIPDIPQDQIYGINEDLLFSGKDTTDAIAKDYQSRVFNDGRIANATAAAASYLIDCALLGFGPDGHTCSLFPNHDLLHEHDLLVASIDDSPKPPPKRITLTMKALNQYTRDVIFVGAGESKADILHDIFDHVILLEKKHVTTTDTRTADETTASDSPAPTIQRFNVTMNNETIYPCGMVRPISDSLHYITDKSATKKLQVNGNFNHCLSYQRSSM